MEVVCKYCGQKVKSKYEHCKYCGAPIVEEIQSEETQTIKPKLQRKESSRDLTVVETLFFIFLPTLLFFLVIIVFSVL